MLKGGATKGPPPPTDSNEWPALGPAPAPAVVAATSNPPLPPQPPKPRGLVPSAAAAASAAKGAEESLLKPSMLLPHLIPGTTVAKQQQPSPSSVSPVPKPAGSGLVLGRVVPGAGRFILPRLVEHEQEEEEEEEGAGVFRLGSPLLRGLGAGAEPALLSFDAMLNLGEEEEGARQVVKEEEEEEEGHVLLFKQLAAADPGALFVIGLVIFWQTLSTRPSHDDIQTQPQHKTKTQRWTSCKAAERPSARGPPPLPIPSLRGR